MATISSGIAMDANIMNLKEISLREVRPEVPTLMVSGENMVMAFQTVRDQVIFTDKRIFVVNVQGITGKKISDHNISEAAKEPVYNAAYFVLTDDRDLIYERIDKRVDEMMENGLPEEVQRLLDSGIDPSNVSMQAIGYKEVVPYLRGEYSRDDAAYQIKLRTRHFAKRQLTWYKREPDVIYIDRRRFDGNTEDMCRFMSDECRKRGII